MKGLGYFLLANFDQSISLNQGCYFIFWIPLTPPNLYYCFLLSIPFMKSADYELHPVGIWFFLTEASYSKICSLIYCRLYPLYGLYIIVVLLFLAYINKQWLLLQKNQPQRNDFACWSPREPYILEFHWCPYSFMGSIFLRFPYQWCEGNLSSQVLGFQVWYPCELYY